MKLINGHPIKRALICYVLLMNGPQKRIPLMRAVHALERSKLAFRPTSNKCYFLRDRYNNPYISHKTAQSVLVQGLVEKVGLDNRFHVYGLTEAGRALGEQVARWYDIVSEHEENHRRFRLMRARATKSCSENV